MYTHGSYSRDITCQDVEISGQIRVPDMHVSGNPDMRAVL